jgi:hypothetical protein
MAYARSPIILALDRPIFNIPLEERRQLRTSDLVAWTKTMFSVIRRSISEARKELRTGHQDIRTYFSDTAAPERAMNATLNNRDSSDHSHRSYRQSTNSHSPATSAYKNPARSKFYQYSPVQTCDIFSARYGDIRTYFSAMTAAAPI